MKKYNVYGRIRADVQFEQIVEASTEKSAVRKAEKIVYERIGITISDVLDDEIYVEKLYGI